MTEFFESIGSLWEFILNQLSNLGRYFEIGVNAFKYMLGVLNVLPLYLKAFVLVLLALSVVFMILDRGA